MNRVLCILLLSSVPVLSCFAANDVYTGAQIRVTLVSEQQAFGRGRTGNVGLRFEMQPGWHVYWINPGDSGEPPKVQWQVPSGVEIGPLQWPVPERIVSFSLVDYGYNNSVLLIAPIRVPANYAGSDLSISGNVKWVVCREVCVPGKATLQKQFEIAGTARDDAAIAGMFNDTRSRTPRPLPTGWKTTAKAENEYFVLNLKGVKASGALYFPMRDSQIDNAAPQKVTKTADGLTLRLKKSEYLSGTPKQLEGVLILPSGDAYIITAPVSDAVPAKQSRTENRAPKEFS